MITLTGGREPGKVRPSKKREVGICEKFKVPEMKSRCGPQQTNHH